MADFYIASSFENKAQVQELMCALVTLGHTVTHDWTQQQDAYIQHSCEHAQKDMNGVLACTHFIGLFDKPLAPLNTYVELGIALGRGKHIYIIGDFDDKCIFSKLPGIVRLKTIKDFLAIASVL